MKPQGPSVTLPSSRVGGLLARMQPACTRKPLKASPAHIQFLVMVLRHPHATTPKSPETPNHTHPSDLKDRGTGLGPLLWVWYMGDILGEWKIKFLETTLV